MCFSNWAPTRFPEAICPKYDPVNHWTGFYIIKTID